MKKKICIIHKVNTLDPRSFYKEGRTLSEAGYDVSMLGLFNKDEIVNGIRLSGSKPTGSRLFRMTVCNYKIFFRALKERADVYHFHDLDFIPWAVLLKLLTRSKVIYDIHESFPEYMLIKTYIPKYLRIILYALTYLVEHSAIKVFDAIVPNDNFVSKGFSHKHNVVIFNFPTLDFFNNKNEMPWLRRKYDLFYHGSLPKYHFQAMMNIAEKLNLEKVKNLWGIVTNDKLVLMWARLEIKKRGLDKNFVFLPYIDYLRVHDYLIEAKIGVIPLPSFRKFMKNIPLKMFEFMGSGMPIVLSKLPPSIQFISGKNCSIAVEPDNFDEYVKAIKLLLNNPKKAVEMGENGKKLVFEQYNWTVEGRKLLQLYHFLLT